MNEIEKLVELAHTMSAMMDDVGVDGFSERGGIFGRARFSVSPEFFFSRFKGFNIRIYEDSCFRYLLTKEVKGVEFITFVNDLEGINEIRSIRQNAGEVNLKRNKKSLLVPACE